MPPRPDNELSELEARIHEENAKSFRQINELLHKLQRQLVVRWVIAVIGLLIVAMAVTYVAIEASHTAHSAKNTTSQIVDARKRTIQQSCDAQNQRNVKTIQFFNGFVSSFEKTHHLSPEQRRQLQGQVQSDVTLINDLQPHQNCANLVRIETSNG